MASSIQPRRDDLDGLDDATAQMIIALQLEDLAEEERTAEASEATSQQTESAGTAHSLYRQTLEECQTNIKDRQLARSMMTAVLADASMIGSLVAEESRAREDRAMALEMAGQSNTVTLPAALPPLQEHPGELLSRMANRYVHPAVGRALMPNDVLERETQRGGNEGGANARTYRCSSCLDDKSYFEVLTAPCNHIYCETCLRDLFSRSLTDESLFPPRCCRLPIPIDLTGIEFFLPGDLRSAYETRRIETSTQDRTYCSNTSCGKFVLPSRMAGNRASCPACLTVTCVACKRGYHTGACVRDEAHEQALELAARQGWRRCSGCQNMVELNTGCNHMTCTCGHNFCYICGIQWKHCTCPQWNEQNLYNRADRIVDRDPNAPQEGEARRELVEQVAHHIVERHDCTHLRWWNRVEGEHDCEECGDTMRNFILQCPQCLVQMCLRCKNNRLR